MHQNGGPWRGVYNNVQALVMFFLAYVSVDWLEEFYMRWNSKVGWTKQNIYTHVGNGPLFGMHS